MNIKKRLRQARPKLRQVAPLTWSISWGFAVINILLGIAMIATLSPRQPIAVANIFSYPVWGSLFAALGVYTAFALLRNDWTGSRYAQLVGLLMKSVWMIALFFRTITNPQTLIITILWLFFCHIQAMVYIYFVPPIHPTPEEIGNA